MINTRITLNLALLLLSIVSTCFTCSVYGQTDHLESSYDSIAFVKMKAILNGLSANDYIKRDYSEDGRVLPYRLLYPLNADPQKKYPLVITLHNSARLGTDNEKQLEPLARIWLRPGIRQRYQAYVVAPQFAERPTVYVTDSSRGILVSKPVISLQSLLLNLVAQLKQQLNIDSSKIYLVGYSMGASTAQNLLNAKPGWFAAAVTIAAVPDFSHTAGLQNKSIWLIHGDKDTDNPFSGSQALFRDLKNGKHTRFTICENLDHDNINYPFLLTDTIPAWLFDKRNTAY